MKLKAEWVTRFQSETIAQLKVMWELMLTLDGDETGPVAEVQMQAMRQLFIKAHSIKGTAGMLALPDIANIAASLEELWDTALHNPARPDAVLKKQASVLTTELAALVAAIKTS
jgi:chemotaxis protein histidine kinase CheA